MKIEAKRIRISIETDITKAIFEAEVLAKKIGFKKTQQFMVATTVSELARNIFKYAIGGTIIIKDIKKGAKKGIEITAKDDGPGIEDVKQAMQDNFSTTKSLGLGLPGAKRLMDEFRIDTKPGQGTEIITRKWT